jgi:putrescine aminotransferase
MADARALVPGQANGPDRRAVVVDRYARHVNRSLASLANLIGSPVELRSSGTRVSCDDGKDYLDCGGFGVFLLGHRHPAVVRAVRHQLDTHPLATRLFLNEQLAEAAASLTAAAPAGLEHAFFTCSGAEATELGLKLARLAGRTRVVAMEGGFHGKSLGAVSVTGRSSYRDPFLPLLPGVEFVPFGDTAALASALAGQGDRTAVVLEPVQAEGGVHLPPPGYLQRVRALCDATGAVLVLDEIQTGLGRLGGWWGADLAGVTPDLLLAGKVLGGGVMPVGAVLATTAMFAPLDRDPLLHSSTFAGSPLATAAVTATLDVLRTEGLVERTAELGPQVLDLVREAVGQHCPQLVNEVRGQGLLVGIDFVSGEAATEFMIGLLEEQVIPSYSLNASHVLRLTPPALLDDADLAWLGRALRAAAAQAGRALAPPSSPQPHARVVVPAQPR